jgi:hypothetical protein
MFVWVAMTVVTVGWDYQRTDPPAVIAISLRGLSSIKHAQESLMTLVARNSSAVRQSKTILARSWAPGRANSTIPAIVLQKPNVHEGRRKLSQGCVHTLEFW